MEIQGVVLDTDGKPLGGIPVESPATGDRVLSGSDGSFGVEALRQDPRLRLGGLEDASFVARIQLGAAAAGSLTSTAEGASARRRKATAATASQASPGGEGFLVERPFFLAFGGDGFARGVPPGPVASDILVDDPTLPGLELVLPAGADVSYPPDAREEVFVVGVAHDQLPLPFPGRRLTRFAVMVGPLGVGFGANARLVFPNVEGLAPGTALDLVELDPSTGTWQVRGEIRVGDGGAVVEGARIVRGGLYAALPRIGLPRTTVRGRILGPGNEPLADWQAVTRGGYSAVSDGNGFFAIEDLPVWPDRSLRVVVTPPPGFRREFVQAGPELPVLEAPETANGDETSTGLQEPVTDFGNIRVRAALRSGFGPTVSYSPGDGEGGVEEFPRVRARFDRPMDLSTVGIQVVRGISREQQGVRGTSFLRFPDGATEIEFIPTSPLRNGEFYSVFVPRDARDLQGNRVDPDAVSSRFTVRGEPPVLGDRELRVHAVEPNAGVAGEDVVILGTNLNPEEVRFGAATASVREFDASLRDFLVVRVPLDIAGEVPVQVQNLEEDLQGDIPFRPLPTIEAFETLAPVASPEGALGLVALGAHLGSSPAVVWKGLRGGMVSTLEEGDCPIQSVPRRRCFAVTPPEEVCAGPLYVEVDGVRTRGFFVVVGEPPDELGPQVVATSVAEGGTVAANAEVILEMSEFVDQASRVEVEVEGEPVEDVEQRVVPREAGFSDLVLTPPGEGWPPDVELGIAATGSGVVDLRGNPLDQDAATPDREPFRLTFTRAAP